MSSPPATRLGSELGATAVEKALGLAALAALVIFLVKALSQ